MDELTLITELGEGLIDEGGQFLNTGEGAANQVVLAGVSIGVIAGMARPPQSVSVTLTGSVTAVLANNLIPIETHIVTLEIVIDETLPTVFAVEMYPALVTGS